MYERLYPSRYERDEGGNDKMLVTVWLEAKDESILGSRNRHVTMALPKHFILNFIFIFILIIQLIILYI